MARGSVLLASLLLPGLGALVATEAAHAESAPEKTTLSFKLGQYDERQGDWERVSVQAPMVSVQAPIGPQWSVDASWVGDTVSGASPRIHSQRSSASRMSDYRSASDVRVTRYFDRAAVSASVAYSDEHDYTSSAFGLEGRWSSDDNNRSWVAGVGYSDDRIDNSRSGLNTAINQRRHTLELMAGITQVINPTDIVQANLTRSQGAGYYNDPYKLFDTRPDHRDAWIALLRWNHALPAWDAALRTSYRYYNDSFGVSAHTFGVDWVQPKGRWTFTPGVRYTSQSAADFFVAPTLDAAGQYDATASLLRLATTSGLKSADQRLAAFGALTVSMKVAYAISPDTTLDVKLERYHQAAGLYLGGSATAGLDAMDATFTQIGLTHRF